MQLLLHRWVEYRSVDLNGTVVLRPDPCGAVVGTRRVGALQRGGGVSIRLGHGASGGIRRFAGWVARGSVGHPPLDGIDYWAELKDSPSQAEICFAIFANVLELDDQGEPINEKYAERRAATWLYRYCTGELPPGEPDFEPWECELY
jgi:hypothetical protein